MNNGKSACNDTKERIAEIEKGWEKKEQVKLKTAKMNRKLLIPLQDMVKKDPIENQINRLSKKWDSMNLFLSKF